MSKAKRAAGDKRRIGRPVKDDADRLQNVVRVRVTDEQLEMFRKLAARDEREISEWIRRAAVKVAEAELEGDEE